MIKIFLFVLLGLTASLKGDDLKWKWTRTNTHLQNGAAWRETPGFGAGITFDGKGASAVAEIPWEQFKSDFSVTFFFLAESFPRPRPDNSEWEGALFSAGYDILGRVYSDRTFRCAVVDDTGKRHIVQSDGPIRRGQWHHAALVYSARQGIMLIYLDGWIAGSLAKNIRTVKAAKEKTMFGSDPDRGRFHGTLAGFQVASVAFSPDEIRHMAVKPEIPLPEAEKSSPLRIFVTDPFSTTPILPDTVLPAEQLGKTIFFRGTPGEFESASFVLRSRTEQKKVSLQISDLKSGANVIPPSQLDPRLVRCWYQSVGAWRSDATAKEPSVLVPELLLNDPDLVRVDEWKKINYLRYGREGSSTYVNVSDRTTNNNTWQKAMRIADHPIYDAPSLRPVTLRPGRNQQFFLTLHIPEGAAPGTYTGKITLNSAAGELDVLRIEAEVLPFTLPEPRTYYNLDKPFITGLYYNSILWDDDAVGLTSFFRNEKQIKAELRNLAEHGVMHPTNFQLNAGGNKGITEERFRKLFRRMLRLRREAGLASDVAYLISNPNINLSANMKPTPENLAKLTERAKDVMDLVEAELGHRNVYFYGVDEARGEKLKAQIPFFEAIRKAGAKTFCAGYRDYPGIPGNFSVIGPVQDLLVCALQPEREESAKWHSITHDVWCYYYPQSGCENPGAFRRNFGLDLWKCNYDGAATFCYWLALGHPWNDFDSTIHRDLNFVYPTADGVVNTLAFEGYREAFDDIRYATKLLLECRAARSSGNAGRIAAANEAERFLEERDVREAPPEETRHEIIKRILNLLHLAEP